MSCRDFNVRVYGLLINSREEVLLTDEVHGGKQFTKFPGGGLEKGEGMIDCLKREFREELNIEISEVLHFYTTDFYQESAFDGSQVISVYYTVGYNDWSKIEVKSVQFDFGNSDQIFRWKPIEQLVAEDLTFPIDQVVLENLKDQ